MKGRFWIVTAILFWVILLAIGVWWYNYSPNKSPSSVTPDPRGYTNCSEAHSRGVYDIPRSSPAYRSRQDLDHDGLACEHYP